MLQGIKNTARSSIIYGLGNISTKLVGIVLLPLYTNTQIISIDEFGVLGVVDVSIQILAALFGFSLYQAFFRWYWDKEYINQRKSIFYTLLVTLTLVSGLLVLLGYLFSGQLSALFFNNIAFERVVSLMMLCTALQIVSQLPFSLMRIEEKPIFYTATNLLRLLVSLVLTILFLTKTGKGLNGIYEAQVWGHVAYFVVTSRYIFKRIKPTFNLPILKEMLVYSMPLAVASVSGVILSTLDRYVLNYRATLLDVGIYTLAFRVTNTIRVFVVHSVQLAVAPTIFKLMNHPNSKQLYARIMTYFSLLVVFAALIFSLFGFEILDIFTTDSVYLNAYKLIPLLSLGILFGTIKDVAINGLNIAKKTFVISIIVPLVALFHLALSYTIIPFLGVFGAAISSTFSQIVVFLAVLYYAQKYYPIPYEFIRLATPLIIAAALYGTGFLVADFNLWTRIALKSVIVIFFPVALWLSNFLEADERQWVKGWVKKWLKVNIP